MGNTIPIRRVVSLCDLTPRPGADSPSATSVNYKCPFCDTNNSKKYTLNVNFTKDMFCCPKCGTKGGAIHLYAMCAFGEAYVPKTERGFEILQALKDATNTNPAVIKKANAPQPVASLIPIASDEAKNRVYRALMQFSVFALSNEHREHLMKRGLPREWTSRYRTLPSADSINIPAPIIELYEKEHLEKIRAELPVRVSKQEALFGLYIVQQLSRVGITDLQGIPGFYKLGAHWCMYVTEGILIPTKNVHGQTVCFQVRKQTGKLRYMTLSQKCLPGAVQDGISRCHITTNISRNSTTKPAYVILTEGPLKADVICALSKKPILAVAIQGINNTNCLQPVLNWLKEQQVREIYNTLDMDRITNKNVRKGSVALRKLITGFGFAFPTMVWDRESAVEKIKSFETLAAENHVKLPERKGNAFVYLANVCIALERAGIAHSEKHENWPSRSKGYDDWLKYLKDKENEDTEG